MSMSYNSLVASKGTSGSIATWASYSLLDLPALVDEAQSLLYGEARLRTREMMTSMVFTMPVNSGYYGPLPSNFLEPIGKLYVPTYNIRVPHKDSAWVEANRNYTETTGTLGTNPFTTEANSNTVSVALANHGFQQDGIFYTTGATALNGATIAGTFPITGITDANNFTIDITSLGTTPTSSGTGGGSAVTYICDTLTAGTPMAWGILGNSAGQSIIFDTSFFQTSLCRLQYYQSLPLLSTTNPTNFLTSRYPKLMRVACLCAAAEFMKDDTEYQKWSARLIDAIERVSNENDMQYRGMELDPEIP